MNIRLFFSPLGREHAAVVCNNEGEQMWKDGDDNDLYGNDMDMWIPSSG